MSEQDEEVGMELEISNALPLISSPGSNSWQIQQIWEPGLLYFDPSSLPASPMEELTLWTYSLTSHESGAAAAKAQAHDAHAQLLEDKVNQAVEEFIQRFCKDLRLEKMRMELLEQNIFDLRFGEKVYTAGMSQVSLSMLTMETKSENPVCGKPLQVVDEIPKFQFMQLDAKSPPEESTLHIVQSRGDCALPDSFQQRSITEHVNLKRKVDTGPSGQDLTIFELGNKQKTNKKSKKTWRIGESVSLEDLKEQFGKKREEAAENLHVSISTLKRICRERGISRWPSTTIQRKRLLLSSVSCNETDRIAANAQMPITRGPTAFASTISVKSNQQKSWSSNLSVNNENGTSLNDNFLGKNENCDRVNIMIQVGDSVNQELLYKPQEFEPACDSLVPACSFPDAPTILSRLPQERMPAKDATQFISSAPGQQREWITRQIEMTDEISQLEKQYLERERLNRNIEKNVILSVEDSSSYNSRNVSEPIQGHLSDCALLCRLNEDQSTCIEAQSMLESKSEPSIQNDARTMKLIFEKLILLPLEAFSNPNHEASMKEALTILAGNLSLFTDEQAKQLLEFKFDFPTITYSWRDCSQSRIDCQNFLDEFEKTKSLLDTSTKEEEDLKDRYAQIECKEKEVMAQLEAIQKEKNEITKQRSENFNQTKHLAALAEEQAGKTKEKELQMTIASDKLNKLMNQWVSVQSSFN